MSPIFRPERRAHWQPESETLDANSAAPRDPQVAQFVRDNQHAEHAQHNQDGSDRMNSGQGHLDALSGYGGLMGPIVIRIGVPRRPLITGLEQARRMIGMGPFAMRPLSAIIPLRRAPVP